MNTQVYALGEGSPHIFGHGTRFNPVNIYGSNISCGPSYINQKSA